MQRRLSLWILAGWLIWPLPAGADTPYAFVGKGNEAYQNGDYDAAIKYYGQAAELLPEAAEIHYNLGNVFYRRSIFDKALEYYSRALQSALDTTLESRIEYNLGNVKYQQAIAAMRTFQDAMTPLNAAMAYYRDSLRLATEQPDARYNLELAQRMMAELRQQKVQPQNNPGLRNQKTSDNAGQQFEQAGNQQDQPQNLPDQPQQGDQQPTQGNQAQQAPPPESASTADSQSQQASLPQQQEMTPDQAEQMIELARERAKAKQNQRQQSRQMQMRDGAVEKFW
jgi:tetratricopeptide (TPR) repeat protein